MGSHSIRVIWNFRGLDFLLPRLRSATGPVARLEPHSFPIVVVTSVPVFLSNPLPWTQANPHRELMVRFISDLLMALKVWPKLCVSSLWTAFGKQTNKQANKQTRKMSYYISYTGFYLWNDSKWPSNQFRKRFVTVSVFIISCLFLTWVYQT